MLKISTGCVSCSEIFLHDVNNPVLLKNSIIEQAEPLFVALVVKLLPKPTRIEYRILGMIILFQQQQQKNEKVVINVFRNLV